MKKKISENQERKLVKAAIEGMKNAFTGTNKPADFRVGAAVLKRIKLLDMITYPWPEK